MEENKQRVEKQMTGDIATGGPTRTPEQLERMAWQQRKEMHVDSLTPDELRRAIAEKEERERQQRQDAIETQKAFQQREKQYWDDIEKSCLDGEPEERFARALIRMSMKGIFSINPMQDPREKARIIADLLKCHGIALKDSKTKPSRTELEQTVYFVSDPFVRKADVTLTRRSMFPVDTTTSETR